MMAKTTSKKRGIYLLPNIFTTVGLFAAFYAVVSAMRGLYDTASIAIFVAMIADTLDGRVARLTQTQSPFGAEYDSLSDMVAFGVAPALVLYTWALQYFGKFGWLSAFIYTACAALRLARFNTQQDTQNKRYFQGLNVTIAAGTLASFVWSCNQYGFSGFWIFAVAAVLTLTCAALMVSDIRYRSFKDFSLRGRVPFVALLLLVLIIVAISIDPPIILFVSALIYVGSGPVSALIRMQTKRKRRQSCTK